MNLEAQISQPAPMRTVVPAVTKKQKVLEYAKANPNASAEEIAAAIGTFKQYVHTVMYLERKKTGQTKKIGRPRKAKKVAKAKVAEAPKPTQVVKSLNDLKIDRLLEDNQTLRGEVAALHAVIRYLEHKLEERRRGVAV